jgi:hypothetical protein
MKKIWGILVILAFFVLVSCQRDRDSDSGNSDAGIQIEETSGMGSGFESSFFPLRILKL